MKTVTLFETAVQWHSIEVEDDFDEASVDDNPDIRQAMWDSIADSGWDGVDVLEARWEVE